jgi:hypothetical protein
MRGRRFFSSIERWQVVILFYLKRKVPAFRQTALMC